MSETQLEDADHTPFWIMKISIGKVVECKKKKIFRMFWERPSKSI